MVTIKDGVLQLNMEQVIHQQATSRASELNLRVTGQQLFSQRKPNQQFAMILKKNKKDHSFIKSDDAYKHASQKQSCAALLPHLEV